MLGIVDALFIYYCKNRLARIPPHRRHRRQRSIFRQREREGEIESIYNIIVEAAKSAKL